MRCYFKGYFKLVGLVITCFYVSLSPAFGQICSNNYTNQNTKNSTENSVDDESPVQRVGTALSDRNLGLYWSKPTDFTEFLPFAGEDYQLAEHEGVAIKLAPCKPPQSFKYVYDPVIHLGWEDLLWENP